MSHCGQYHIFFRHPMVKGKFIMLRLLFIFPLHKVEEHKRLQTLSLLNQLVYLYLVSGSIALMDKRNRTDYMSSTKSN